MVGPMGQEFGREELIRVGMIQGTERVRFKVLAPHRVRAGDGTAWTGAAGQEYVAELGGVEGSRVEYWARLAVAAPDAEDAPAQPPVGAAELRSMVVGRRVRLPRLEADNRERWLLAGPFGTRQEAEVFRRRQEKPGEIQIVRIPTGRATGWVRIDGRRLQLPVRVEPREPSEPQILLRDVLIGIEFHWQHHEDEHLRGVLEIAPGNDGRLVAVNELPIESYLASVNSSEMTADSPMELLKAQTVAARSTIFATVNKHHYGDPFDLCADDHCQCYYGADREQERSWEAVRSTWGEVLVSGAEICDARYSKICGGLIEDFRFVWEDRPVPYLVSGIDGRAELPFPADSEEKARELIDDSPDVYCNVDRYDLPPSLRQRCEGLFRWEVRCSREELEKLLAERAGVRVGKLLDLVPLERGHSGRIVYLEVVGTEGRAILGKELEIRRALSPSHLYSSCFYVEKELGDGDEPAAFVLKGAGWGHGVGLCQVGATVMAAKGFDYREILAHYYKNTRLVRAY